MAHFVNMEPGPIRYFLDLDEAIDRDAFYYQPDEQCTKHPTSPFETKTRKCRDCLAQSDWSRG